MSPKCWTPWLAQKVRLDQRQYNICPPTVFSPTTNASSFSFFLLFAKEKEGEREDLYYNAILFLFTCHLDTHTFFPPPLFMRQKPNNFGKHRTATIMATFYVLLNIPWRLSLPYSLSKSNTSSSLHLYHFLPISSFYIWCLNTMYPLFPSSIGCSVALRIAGMELDLNTC